METPKWDCKRYRVTAERKAEAPRIWIVYEAESGAIIAKKLDESEAQTLCEQLNVGKMTQTIFFDAHRS
jgi:IS1 family transposase